MRERLRTIWQLVRNTFREWQHDNAMMLAAAVAFYATFSLAPLLLLLVHGGALIFGEEAALRRLLDVVANAAGERTAGAVQRIIVAAADSDTDTTLINVGILIIGASAVFRQLKQALNLVLDVPTEADGGVLPYLRKRAFAIVVVIAVIALIVAGLVMTAVTEWLRSNVPDTIFASGLLWRLLDRAIFFILLAFVFAAILKYVPDVALTWRHVAPGAIVAALLYVLGQLLLGLYLAHGNLASAYGAAGSVVLLLVYVYFTVAVLLAAAELSEVIARRDPDFRYARQRAQSEHQYAPRKE